MEYLIENIELLYTPITKQLLINYVKIQNEENADITDESLKRELLWLNKYNEMDQLILAEYLTSEARQLAYTNENSKSIVKERLINMIKSKYEEVEYDYLLKDYHLIKGDNGLFRIEIPTSGTIENKLSIQ
tara:strand:+ start:19387 stop:19779 length:393 start_codon:yes stop_codon:yes gene_type:complete